jgi:TolB-like protein/Flp pilus assembly protein TadD
VLPFQPSGDAEAGEYLATGLTDGVITELSRLQGVVVPGYPTVSRYRESGKPLSRIARELQVGSVLEAGLRAAAGSVQVEARLLDAETGKPRWTRRYHRPVGELADLQRELTRETAKALGLRPTRAERALLEPAAVRPEAYATYLRGRAAELAGHPRDLWTIIPPDQVRRAQSLYSQARDLDPDFALARARLALMHNWSSWLYDTTAARREQARLEAETALRLRPGLAEAHEALANYWEGRPDLARAIEERKLAIRGLPGSAELRQDLGNTYAQAGRLEEAAAQLDSGMQLDPGSPNAAFAAAMFHSRLRRGEEAMRAYDRALALAPGYHMVKVIKGHTWLRWKGTADTLAAALAGIPRDWDPRGMATWARYTALRVQRRDAEALIMLDSSPSELSRDGLVYQPEPLMRAQLHEALGQRDQARAHYAAARALLLDSVRARPGDAAILVALGLASAGLGRRADAVREARRAMELMPVGDYTPAVTAFMGVAAEVFAKAGETGAAIELLELLFAMPAGREVTIPYLKVWPGFDPLRGDPRFEALLERYGG